MCMVQVGLFQSPLSMRVPSVKRRRKSPDGISTNELIFTGYRGTSEEVFPDVLSLYVKPGSTVADVTFGKGVFWKKIPKAGYRLQPTDLKDG